MQDTFTLIWRRPRGFNPERGSLRGYVFGIGRKLAAEWWRRQKPTEAFNEEPGPCQTEMSSMVADAFNRLSTEQRTLLWLREVEGQSYAELASILEVPISTVRSRLLLRGKHYATSGIVSELSREVCMTCDEAELVSALCDGETIPRAAAEHVSMCASCQARLEEYMEMGAELRLFASLAVKENISPRVWSSRRNTFAIWWQKGWETMRIPRLAFAILIAAIVALGSTLAVVKVHAHSDGTVVMLKIARPEGDPVGCPLSTQDKNQATCAFIGQMNGKITGYRIDLISREDNRVGLAVRTKTFGPISGTFSLSDIQSEPQKQVLFEPGQTLELDVAGSGTLTVTGEWFDHMPAFIGSSNHELDPGPEELRLVSPLLLSDKQVLGDLPGGIATVDKTGQGVAIYMPGEGRFILSLSPMQGSVQAHVALNRISFQDGGRSYAFLTGSSVTRGENIWVLHEATFKPLDLAGEHAFISSGDLHQLVPGDDLR